MRRGGLAEAREITGEAHAVSHEVLQEGTEISRNMRELSVSLRNNAERLLRDVRLAHGGMTARLDQAAPSGKQPEGQGQDTKRKGRSEPGEDGPNDDLEVPS